MSYKEFLYMSDKKSKAEKQAPVQSLNREHINAFRAIAANKTRIKLDQEAISDDIKALCDKLGWNGKKVNSVLSTFMKEEEKGGVIKESNEVIDAVEQILGLEQNLANQGEDGAE